MEDAYGKDLRGLFKDAIFQAIMVRGVEKGRELVAKRIPGFLLKNAH